MLRIDDNTYIDDTLVTCAEYQLFIDEMREQEKYYQPDHWTSYQFPVGQALEPTLGVRHSDAIAFCDWLTRREDAEWGYRLLTSEEAKKHPIKPNKELLLHGYWISNSDNQSRLAWMGSVTVNPHNFDRDIYRYFELYQIKRDSILYHDFTRALDRARYRALDRKLYNAGALDRTLDLADALDNTHALAHALDRTHYTQVFDRTTNHILDHNKTSARALNLDRLRRYSLHGDIDLYVDIVILQERIAGRSPAFEGMRLVKERIR